MSDKKYAVVVCGYNEMFNLPRCLKGLIHTVEKPEDLIFVDDASTDNSYEWVIEHYPQITRLRNQKNKHYAGAYNAGIRVAIDQGKDYVLMVNADTEVVEDNFVKKLVNVAERLQDAGFIGPKVYYRQKGEIQNTSLLKPTLWRHIFGWFCWRVRPSSYNRFGNQEHRAEFINTVCCLIRARTINEAGLMDEKMGIYCEDAEWMTRAEGKGWNSYYVPKESIIHHEKRTGYEHYSLKTFMLKRNIVYYMLLRRGWNESALYALFAVALAIIRFGFAPLKRESMRRHIYFLRRLVIVYWKLLLRKPLGHWFGPPLGSWNNSYFNSSNSLQGQGDHRDK